MTQLVLFANTEPLIPQKLSVSLRIGGVRSRTDCSALGTRHNDKPPMLIAQRCNGQIRIRTERTRPQRVAFVTLFVLSCFQTFALVVSPRMVTSTWRCTRSRMLDSLAYSSYCRRWRRHNKLTLQIAVTAKLIAASPLREPPSERILKS